MARTMSDASNGLTTAQRTFDDLGVKVQNADGSLRAVPDVILEIADRLAGMKDATKQAALAQEAFGRSGLNMLPVLKEGSAAIRAHMEEARRLGVVWTSEAARDAVIFKDNVERLEGAVEGLSMKLANPLIRRLGEVSEAMLNAQRRSEGFFTTLAAGWRALVSPTTEPLDKQVVELTDKLVRLQDIGDRLRNRPVTPMNLSLIEANNKAIDETRAKLKGIVDFQAALIPHPDKPAARPTGDGGGGGRMSDAEKKAEEERRKLLGEQYQWQLDEEQRVRDEIDAIYIAAHEKRLENEKQRQADLQAAKIEGYDWEQEQAIAQGEELLAIDAAVAAQKKAQREREKSANADFWNNLAGLMNTGSKKAFEIGKAFSIGQAAIKGASAVMSAWEAGMSTGGPWAPLVAAAYAATAGLNAINMINNIKSQQFGGGGGAPVHPTQGASGVSPVGDGGGQQSGRQVAHTTVVLPATDLTSTSAVRQMLLGLQEEISANGGSLTVR
jgi:hypothetical protein